jgi:hypothetical protein
VDQRTIRRWSSLSSAAGTTEPAPRIRDARFAAVERRVRLLTPIIAAVTGLFCALIGLLTYLRKS